LPVQTASRRSHTCIFCTRLLAGLALASLLLGAQAQTSTDVSPLTPGAAPSPAASGTVSWGTGFVVGEGYVLTAWHVIKDRNKLMVGPTANARWVSAEVVQIDSKLDLALLKANVNLPALRLASRAHVPHGLEVSVIGYPQPRLQGQGKKITHGIVNGYHSDTAQMQDTSLMQISAEVAQGNSGGPVLAPDGTVVGMVLRKLDAAKVAERSQDVPTNVNFALRSAALVQFMEKGPVAARTQEISLQTVLRPYQVYEQFQGSVLTVVGQGQAGTAADNSAR
jgi:S1-C subfamily serine protease